MKMKLSCLGVAKIALLFGAIALSGCVSIPQTIKGNSATPVTNLSSVRNAPEMYIGQEGRFGGKVISVDNEQQKTRLEIAVMQLNPYDAAPEMSSPSVGRIYAYVNGFLEPSDFNGHFVTVVGPITGEKQAKIGAIKYNYITLNVTGFQRWQVAQRVILPPMDPWGYGYYGYPRYYNQPWGWGPGYNGGPAPIQTYLTE
nr:Slp family lipoprotein [uncultured Moellerella sp.]